MLYENSKKTCEKFLKNYENIVMNFQENFEKTSVNFKEIQ